MRYISFDYIILIFYLLGFKKNSLDIKIIQIKQDLNEVKICCYNQKISKLKVEIEKIPILNKSNQVFLIVAIYLT